MTRRRYLPPPPRPPQQIIPILTSLSSKTLVPSLIIFFNFITRKGLFFKSEVSIDKNSKKGYLDERTGELPINEIVEIDISVTLLI